MNQIATISGIQCYEEDGVAYLHIEAVAIGLGFTQKKNGKEYIRWETVDHYLKEIGFPNKLGKDTFIPENIFYRLAMKAKSETAERFQALVADEVIPSIRRTGSYSLSPAPAPQLSPSTSDYLKAAQILAKCPDERLKQVEAVLEAAGIRTKPERPRMYKKQRHYTDRERKELAEKAQEAIFKSGRSFQALAQLTGLEALEISEYCHKEAVPCPEVAEYIIEMMDKTKFRSPRWPELDESEWNV